MTSLFKNKTAQLCLVAIVVLCLAPERSEGLKCYKYDSAEGGDRVSVDCTAACIKGTASAGKLLACSTDFALLINSTCVMNSFKDCKTLKDAAAYEAEYEKLRTCQFGAETNITVQQADLPYPIDVCACDTDNCNPAGHFTSSIGMVLGLTIFTLSTVTIYYK